MNDQPDTEDRSLSKLAALREELAAIDRQVADVGQQGELTPFRELYAAHYSLALVIAFLNEHAVDSQALAKLVIELGNLGDGRAPAPMLRGRAESGAMAGIGREFLWGALAAVLHLRQKEGEGREKAARWILRQLPDDVLSYLHNPTWRAVSQWKTNFAGKTSRPGIGLSTYEFTVRNGLIAMANGRVDVATSQLHLVLNQAKSMSLTLTE